MEAKTLDLLDWHGNGIVVERGQELRFPIIVNKSPLSVLHWTFKVSGGGIEFSVIFNDSATETNSMLQRRRHFSDLDDARGSFIVRGCVGWLFIICVAECVFLFEKMTASAIVNLLFHD